MAPDRLARSPHHRLEAKQNNVWELNSPTPAQSAVVGAIVNYVAWIVVRQLAYRGGLGRKAMLYPMKGAATMPSRRETLTVRGS
jgi:hypothetical protein